MELVAAHSQKIYCGSTRDHYTISNAPHTGAVLTEFSNRPELEITPVGNHQVAGSCAKCVQKNFNNNISAEEEAKNNVIKEKTEMYQLLKKLPELHQGFKLYSKIGEGSFSKVYKAALRKVYKAALRDYDSTRMYAVKHLIQNSQLDKIVQEYKYMRLIGGRDNVISAHMFFSDGSDCGTIVMPYLEHESFYDYVLEMDAQEARLYMRNLFIALKRVHSFDVIHRDVKPKNFLYNRKEKLFYLVDFGLAQTVERSPCHGNRTAAADENVPIDYSKKRKRKRKLSDGDEEEAPPQKRASRIVLKTTNENVTVPSLRPDSAGRANDTAPSLKNPQKEDYKSPRKQTNVNSAKKTPLKPRISNPSSCPSSSRKKLFQDDSIVTRHCYKPNKCREESLSTSIMKSNVERKLETTPTSANQKDKSFTPLASRTSTGSFVQVQNSKVVLQQNMSSKSSPNGFQILPPLTCPCSGKGAICSTCSSRKQMNAPRAGTPGYRPPEVLLKYPYQTTAVDMWAAGVIMLCILSGSYPFFKSPNDLSALAEIMTIFGTEPIVKVAAKFGRRVICSHQQKGYDWKQMCVRLRARKKKTKEENSDGPSKRTDESSETSSHASVFPDSAYHLLSRLLDLDPTSRITAAEALNHPFIADL